MCEETRLTGEQMKELVDVSVVLKSTSDQILAEEYAEATAEHARGYLECFMKSAPNDKVLMAYFILRMLMARG